MSKKAYRVFSMILIVFMILSIATSVFAVDFNPSNITGDGANTAGSEQIKNVGNSVVNILQTVGIVLSVVVLIVLGIKYMMGSAEEKADYKKSMLPYLVGAIIIFAASAFANVVYNFATSISSTGA